MNATETHVIDQPAREWTFKGTASASFTEAIGAIGAIVLSIVGLAGILASTLAAIATIVVGAAILVEGGAATSRYRRIVSRIGREGQALELSEGMLTAEFMGGIAGIVLGILALFGTYPAVLLAAALIVFGATFLLTSAALSQLNWQIRLSNPELVHETARQASVVGSDGQLLVGLGALVLGILAVIGLSPLTLVLVGLLSLGVAELFNGSGLGHRMMIGKRK